MANDYMRVRIDASPCTSDITDLAAAFLADAGFESFEPDETGLTAFIPALSTQNAETLAKEALEDFPIQAGFLFSSELIPGRDWNEEWEKNYFKPIVIGDRCVIHSTFHTDVPSGEYDIVIDPKMAFGTGHHHTTSRMVTWLLEEDLKGKSLIDMGTGTGILAILAAMRGANPVTGIEIDPGAYENAVENAALNGMDVKLICGDASALAGIQPADFLLANINRNIIIADLPLYVKALKPGGTMILSGFYDHDIPLVEDKSRQQGLIIDGIKESDKWVAIRLKSTR